ncbi:MAG: Electron transport protein SCO1/SenC [Pedosphaera sp.]|nr:Electron transport protein SCO1/SenC [Pedosphaera sp.]
MIWIALAMASRAQRRKCRLRLLWFAFLILGWVGILLPTPSQAGTTNYFVTGVLKGVKQDEHQLIIAHDVVPNFMDAMTMPFNVKDSAILTNVAIGGKITFQLHVAETESWVDHIEQVAVVRSAADRVPALLKSDSQPEAKTNSSAISRSINPLRDYKFTNELGQPVSLSDFQGQAIALTFFFTRCPIPEFCPRLSRNFEQVQHRLEAMENAPTNWHLISVTFDPDHDTSEVLKAYGASYQYDPLHWSFITGPKDKIAELARSCDVKFDPDNGLFNHNFRTLIIDASNHLQMVFPTSGDLSESIAQELLKAAGGTNRIAESATNYGRSASDK